MSEITLGSPAADAPARLCCVCGGELFEAEIEAGYCEDCRDGGDLEDVLGAALDAGGLPSAFSGSSHG